MNDLLKLMAGGVIALATCDAVKQIDTYRGAGTAATAITASQKPAPMLTATKPNSVGFFRQPVDPEPSSYESIAGR